MTELAPRFNFKEVESHWCKFWEDQNLFHGEARPDREPFSIVIPPPNVTGILHMGHALNNTLQDILIRYKRMQGFETCWMPGTDHAGIATQNVVEKQLAKEGKTRYDIGREELLKRLWSWKQQYGDTIIHQLKKLGSSCDWQRTRFTMDDDYSGAVKEVFVQLFEKGLIYRGSYIINWCPRCQTALSDEEAEHREQQGALYHIRYPFKRNPKEHLIVATTRPETMLGDTAVAVNPNDERYKNFIGETLILPIAEREIKIIADEFVDPAFGTGAVKVTPAHDPNDFRLGQKHHLEFINIMHPDGRMNDQAGEFAGQDRFEAREGIIETLKNLKLLEKVEQHTHAVGHCYRCHTVVEPYLSKQWFVKMQPLAKPALQAVVDGKIKFYPERWTKVYTNWMENIRDWCISRQIWWGHRIPVWYCDTCPEGENLIVSRTAPVECPHCKSKNLKQDEDVLDTWFSSWLWPFATFGWNPKVASHNVTKSQDHRTDDWRQATGDKISDLDYFYPTAALFTASEIIFFWVARMIMAGIEFRGQIPFSSVYIHGTVRDAQGRKMSKSLGNAIDPLEIINEYGADALRFSLIINSGQDLYISKEKFEIGRNFANKIWNATRLVLMNLTVEPKEYDLPKELDVQNLDLASRWIISKFYSTLAQVNNAINSYRFSEAENLVHEFFWKTFCDWYLEITKSKFTDPQIQIVLFAILEKSIRMLHPFMPFVTEEIWQHLKIRPGSIVREKWPAENPALIDPAVEAQMQIIADIIVQVRNLKALWNIKPQQEIDCFFTSAEAGSRNLLENNAATLTALLRLKTAAIKKDLPQIKEAAAGIVADIKFYLPLTGLIDIAKEKTRMQGQIEADKKNRQAISSRLANASYLQRAPAEVVEKDRERYKELDRKIAELEKVIRGME